MTVCARCGQDNPEGFRFCGACGAALEAAPAREVRKTVTVLFCDLTGSTQLGDRLDPESLRATMRRYHAELRGVLERHGGTVEKFIGDAVMAVFGVPRAHEDDALRAVRAAAEVRDAVATLDLEARIGVNTGEVVVGEGETLATGDAVNVAARLEQGAAPGEILLGAETLRLVRDAVEVERVEVAAKGKSAPVEAYRLLDVDPAAPAVARRLDAPLVGRGRELEVLEREFDRAAGERACHVFTLLGSAGVGKSRLVAEFVDRLRDRGRVVHGRCLHYGEGITYWPLVEVLLQLGADPDSVLSQPSPVEAAVTSRKLLETEARQQPLLVVFDDIQWAEPTFLDLIEHVADFSRDAPIFLLCIARPELLEVRAAWGGGKLNATTILLEPLRSEEAARLIENLPGGHDLSPQAQERIIETSGGNPLFVEEMLLMLEERDGGNGEVDVPPTIRALLQARLDLLGEAERAVIERGSIEGQVFHRAPVAELAPLPVRRELDTHLGKLVRKDLIRPETPTIPGDDAFRFRHLLIRDAAYDSLPKETRAELHERFAEWLDEHVTLVEQDEIVGYHLEQAVSYRRELGHEEDGLATRAAERLAAAGFAALGRGDIRAGSNLLERAAALHPRGDSGRLALLPELAFALVDVGRFDDALPYIQELEAARDERSQAYAALLRTEHGALSGGGSFEEGRPAVAEARATFERSGDEVGLARALFLEGHADWTSCRATEAAALYRQALTFAERARKPRVVSDILGQLAAIYSHGPTPVEEAEREVRQLLEYARGHIAAEAHTYRALGRLAAMRGDFAVARELIHKGRVPLREAGLRVLYAASALGEADVEELAGDLDGAARILREGFAQLDELGEHAFASTLAALIANLLVRLEDDDEAARWLARARELSPVGDMSTLTTADKVEALLASRGGDHERALELANRAVEQAETTDFWGLRGSSYGALARVLAAAGRRDEAREAQRTAIDIYEAKGVTVEAERARASLAEL